MPHHSGACVQASCVRVSNKLRALNAVDVVVAVACARLAQRRVRHTHAHTLAPKIDASSLYDGPSLSLSTGRRGGFAATTTTTTSTVEIDEIVVARCGLVYIFVYCFFFVFLLVCLRQVKRKRASFVNINELFARVCVCYLKYET